MMILKACVKCHGDLLLTKDELGQFFTCQQCGKEYPTKNDAEATKKFLEELRDNPQPAPQVETSAPPAKKRGRPAKNA